MPVNPSIAAYAERAKAFNDRQAKAVDGLTEDLKTLNKKIEDLQNSPGAITAEDQAALDEIEKISDGMTAKLEALDSETPPPVPTDTGTPTPNPAPSGRPNN